MNKSDLLKESKVLIERFLDQVYPPVVLDEVDSEHTLIVVVDMINGFAKKGTLYSERIEKLIRVQRDFLNLIHKSFVQFVCDGHPADAKEFKVFPAHCIKGSEESEVVEALKPFVQKAIIYKNSTNGYQEQAFLKLLATHNFENIIIMGCCTDLCVLQLALSLKTHYNTNNEHINIIVPVDGVDTYHLDVTNHPGDFMHLMALKMMQDNGIQLVLLEEQ